MKQDILNNEKNKIQYLYSVQKLAKTLKQVYSNKCKRLKKDILDLNFKKKEVIILKRSKLH